MKAMSRRLAELETAAKAHGRRHLVCKHAGWNEDLVLDHYGRDRIGPDDEVVFVDWGGDNEMPYPAGYFDSDGRWADLCAKYGLPHPDHGEVNPYLRRSGESDVAGEAR